MYDYQDILISTMSLAIIHLNYVLLLVQEKMYQLIISELIILELIILELMADK